MGNVCRRLPFLAIAILAVPPLLAVSPPGWAQIEEITVTARRREEGLQDVPLSVTAFSTADIERRGISNIADIARLTSSLEFDLGTSRSDTRVAIRGLSPTRGRQNVAILVDGIDVSSEAISTSGGGLLVNTRLIDLERIEVIKGPQVVLYGRAAFAGAVQYVTKNPAEEFEATIGVEGDNRSRFSATAGISGPLLGEALGFRLNATWWDESGFYSNSITGDRVGDEKGYGLALTTRSQLGERFTLKFRAEYNDEQASPPAEAFLRFNQATPVPQEAFDLGIAGCFPALVAKTATPQLDQRNERLTVPGLDVSGGLVSPYCETPLLQFVGEVPAGRDLTVTLQPNPFDPGKDYPGVDRQLIRFSLIGDWDLDYGAFRSLTGYLRERAHEFQDTGKFAFIDPALPPSPFIDHNPNLWLFENNKTTRQFSQELRYTTRFEGPLNVTLGGQYWEEDIENDSLSLTFQASGSHCAWLSPIGFTFEQLFGEPANSCYGYTETPIQPFVGGGLMFGDGDIWEGVRPYNNPNPVNRNTEHWSIYGMLEFEMSPTVSLTLAGRYNREVITVEGPIFYDPDAGGGPGSWNICGIFFRPCTEEWLFGADGPFVDRATFESFYDSWNPAQNPELLDKIPEKCLSDPQLLAKLNRLETEGNDGFDLFNPWCVDTLSKTESWFSPQIILDWQITDDMLGYVSWARTRKPGGFSLFTVGASGLDRELAEFEPEIAEFWEIGLKSTWFQRRVVANFAAFFFDYTDKQVLAQTLGADGVRLVSKIENASSAEVWGAELELVWMPATTFFDGNWRFGAAYTWLDTEYKNFEVLSASAITIGGAGNCTPDQFPDGRPACRISFSGNKLERSPDGKFVGSVGWTRPLAGGIDLRLESDFQWTDKRYIEQTNESWMAPYWNVDLRAGLQGDRWEVLAFVTNLLNDDTVKSVSAGPGLGCCFILASGIDIAGQQPTTGPDYNKTVMVDLPLFRSAFLPPPRVVGLRANYRFGGGRR